jgi:hypothetical protein
MRAAVILRRAPGTKEFIYRIDCGIRNSEFAAVADRIAAELMLLERGEQGDRRLAQHEAPRDRAADRQAPHAADYAIRRNHAST